MAIWTGTMGIFEDQGSWVANNDPHHASDGIAIADFTAEGDDYIDISKGRYTGALNAQVNIKQIPGRNHMVTGIGKSQKTVQITVWCIADASHTALYYYNLLEEFCNGHDEIGEPACYLVIAQEHDIAGWEYREFEDNTGAKRKYLKGRIADIKENKKGHGLIEAVIQFQEAWLP